MTESIMFANIDENYSVYYVPGDPEGRWIVTHKAAVVGTNLSMPQAVSELAAKAEAIIAAGAGEKAKAFGAEARELMIQWGWLQPLLSTAEAAKALGITEMRVRQLCQAGRMGLKVGDTWVISLEEIEANKERKAGRPRLSFTRRGFQAFARRGATLRTYLAEFYGDQLDSVLAQEPEAAADLEEPVTEIWQHRERMGGVSHALHAGSTVWVDTPSSHLCSNDDDLSEYTEGNGWQRIYPKPNEQVYERKDDWGGYTVRKSEKGFLVECWSARAGELTDDKYLLPYDIGLVSDYGRDADLNGSHNEYMRIGEYLYSVATESMGTDYGKGLIRVLRKGRIVR